MHQDTKSAQLIAVCKRTLYQDQYVELRHLCGGKKQLLTAFEIHVDVRSNTIETDCDSINNCIYIYIDLTFSTKTQNSDTISFIDFRI